MMQNESLNQDTAGANLFSETDLRLVLESINEASELSGSGVMASVGMTRIGRDVARMFLRSTFGIELTEATSVAVYESDACEVVDVLMEFDLDDLVAELRKDIASGISRNRRLVDFLGGIPVDVKDRIDAAKVNPKMASHFIATAADHLAWALRLRIQDMLLPIADHGRRLAWRGRIPSAAFRDFTGAALFPFATSLTIEIPASLLENNNV